MRRGFISIGLLSLLLGLSFRSSLAAELTNADVEKIVSQCSSLNPQYRIGRADVREHEVTIKLTKAPAETEKDCRINAVLLAKSVMEKDPGVEVVFVWFHATPEKWWIFEPNRSTVSFYGMGNMTNGQLLKNLPLNVHVDALSMDELLRRSAGPGPYPDERLLLMTWFKHHSGRDNSGLYSPLPTIDAYLPRLTAIENEARQKSSVKTDVPLLRKIEELKRDVNQASEAFSRLPDKEKNRQIVTYMKSHHLKLENWTGKVEPQSSKSLSSGQRTALRSATWGGSASTRGNDGEITQLKHEDFIRLSKKYPQYTPDASLRSELGRRQIVALYVMLMAENHTLKPDIETQLSWVEGAAKLHDDATLQTRLKSLERSLGLSSILMQSK